jgi:cell wall-associated NlpC family hydrolase
LSPPTSAPILRGLAVDPGQYVGILADAEHSAPNPAAASAIAFAARQVGLPYVWGGNGPAKGDPGFDCSGLTQAAYASVGISIPRTATAQLQQEPTVGLSALEPGDLVFYGDPTFAHHVGIFVGTINGSGVILDAPKSGEVVGLDPLAADDLFAAARPAASR